MTMFLLRFLLPTAGFAAAAVGLGLYVYPTRPGLVWALLLVCWACYRLSLRARARFGARGEDGGGGGGRP